MSAPIEVRNPRTGKFDYIIIPLPPKLLVQQCSRMRRAQIYWQKLGVEGRIEILQQWKLAIISHRQQLTEALVADTGRLSISVLEVDTFIAQIDHWCHLGQNLFKETLKNTSISFIQLQQEAVPYHLVGIISPWNFPLLLSIIDTIPALIAGCAVVVKPSEMTPRFVTPLLTTLNTVPRLREVLNFVEGDEEIDTTLIEYVDLISFTGGLERGQKVAQAAAKRFIPAHLEFGGKNPAIVLESADLDLATSAILWSSVVNSGQCYDSIERIYVAESILGKFFHLLIAKAHRLQLAYPTVESGEIGPIISETQAAIIKEHLQDAVSQGAILHCGGEVEDIGGGWWCRPTVITQVNHEMKLMTEQTFGPIMPVMTFSNVEEAIRLANDTIYGLSAAVFAESPTEAVAVAQQLDVGAVSINDAALTTVVYDGEKNAFKFSGMGSSRTGATGLTRFMRKKAFLIKTKSIPDAWWFNQN